MAPLVPLQTELLVFRAFGVLFAVLGVVSILRPRAMTAYAVRQRRGGPVQGRIEPTAVRLWFTRAVGVVMVLAGVGLAAGAVGP